jgi:hypothetical protein
MVNCWPPPLPPLSPSKGERIKVRGIELMRKRTLEMQFSIV